MRVHGRAPSYTAPYARTAPVAEPPPQFAPPDYFEPVPPVRDSVAGVIVLSNALVLPPIVASIAAFAATLKADWPTTFASIAGAFVGTMIAQSVGYVWALRNVPQFHAAIEAQAMALLARPRRVSR